MKPILPRCPTVRALLDLEHAAFESRTMDYWDAILKKVINKGFQPWRWDIRNRDAYYYHRNKI